MKMPEEVLATWLPKNLDLRECVLGAMEEYAKQVALEFYEHVESVPVDDMSSDFDSFIDNCT